MKNIVLTAVMLGVISGCASDGKAEKPMAMNMSHAHIKHVSTSWGDTPNKMGFMDTAIAEAKIAAQHASFAVKKTDDLGWMKMHTKHVIHAVDASKIDKGPGLGYGVIKAAMGIAKHINLAASSPEASDHLKLHSVHVATSANNTVARGQKIITLSEELAASNSTSEAAGLMQKINILSQQLLNGEDANGDGKITWQEGEGGLLEAQKHLGFITKKEGV
jgi:hypothetical protein